MHIIKKKEHYNNHQHKTQDIDNGFHPGGTTSLGSMSRWCRQLHYVLSIKMIYIEMMSRSYKEEFPHAGVAPRDVPQLELSIKRLLSV